METIRIQQGDSERIEAYFISTASVPMSGLTPALTIRRQSDGQYFNGTAFTSTFTQLAMSAVDAVNQGGYYSRMFDTTGLADDTYSIICSGTAAGNSPLIGEIKVGGFIDNLDTSINLLSGSISSAVAVLSSGQDSIITTVRANAPVAGGNIINIQGVFSEEEKKKLINLIKDSFNDVMDDFQRVLASISGMAKSIEAANPDAKLNDLNREMLLMRASLNNEIAHFISLLVEKIDRVSSSSENLAKDQTDVLKTEINNVFNVFSTRLTDIKSGMKELALEKDKVLEVIDKGMNKKLLKDKLMSVIESVEEETTKQLDEPKPNEPFVSFLR